MQTRTHRGLVAPLVAALLLVGATSPSGTDTGDGGRIAAYLSAARAVAGLGPVSADPATAGPAAEHAAYLAAVGQLRHTQDPSHPLASPAGAQAAARSVLDAAATTGAPITSHVDRWLSAPFHALELLWPTLRSVGFATATGDHPGYARVAVMDTRSGRDPGAPTDWVAFPGAGATTTRTAFTAGEVPDPLTACPDLHLPTGHPIYLLQPGDDAVVSATLTHDDQVLPHCLLTATTYTNPSTAETDLGRGLLAAAHAVVLIPAAPLDTGGYTVAVTTTTATVTWSFRVGDTDRPATGAPTVSAPTTRSAPVTVTRTGTGADAAAVAASLSRRMLPAGGATAAVICRPDDFADCLAASALAGPTVPVLYAGVAPAGLSAATVAELQRVLPAGATATVVGGPSAVSEQTATDLVDLGYRVRRIAGSDRFATAAAVARQVAPATGRVLLARGDTWPDAVAAGGLAAATGTPVLLATPDALPAATAGALARGADVTVLGGAAAISDAVVRTVAAITGRTPSRLAGADRAGTAAAIAGAWPAPSSARLVADLWGADAWQPVLASAGLAAALGAPVLGAAGASVPPATGSALAAVAGRLDLLVLGDGTGALASALLALLTGGAPA